MPANRVTAFLDACVLAGALKRNLLLSLAEAEAYRPRWSGAILDETETAIRRILTDKGAPDAADRASKSRQAMEAAFAEAMVSDFDIWLGVCADLPDPGDAHVLAAALKAKAAVIVSDNAKHFPESILAPLDLKLRSADAFVALAIEMDPGRAVAAIRRMRERFKRPELDAERLLLTMEAAGLKQTVGQLAGRVASL